MKRVIQIKEQHTAQMVQEGFLGQCYLSELSDTNEPGLTRQSRQWWEVATALPSACWGRGSAASHGLKVAAGTPDSMCTQDHRKGRDLEYT